MSDSTDELVDVLTQALIDHDKDWTGILTYRALAEGGIAALVSVYGEPEIEKRITFDFEVSADVLQKRLRFQWKEEK